MMRDIVVNKLLLMKLYNNDVALLRQNLIEIPSRSGLNYEGTKRARDICT